MDPQRHLTALALICAATLLASPPRTWSNPAASATRLADGFHTPPAAARPWVYWFWLHGNITREGITADLEAMQRAGIGGVLVMEVDQGAPAGPVPFASPQWRELFKHACAEAGRLGLEVNMNNDAGWCGSGGPWVTPELAMQRLVWTETRVEGPERFEGVLPQPAAVAGCYRDVAVLAFPEPEGPERLSGVSTKACFTPVHASLATRASWPEVLPGAAVAPERVLDLTRAMAPGGRLTFDAPGGAWTILRLGHTPTGQNNHPAPASGRGFECDKLSREAVEVHFAGLMGKLVRDVGPLAGKTLVSTHIDSWEVGVQNWTPGFRSEFHKRRGYDPLPWLPVVTGRIVGGTELSERFLWDLRQTISALLLDNYAGHMRELAHRHGLRLSIEAYHTCPCDELAYAGRADEPMGEFWSWGKYGAAFSLTEMASAAHVYGRRIVGAEAFTATNDERWLGHPGNIKELGDWAFCEGINRFVIHRYALQPWLDRRPGMSMGPWGLHYERPQTWWEHSRAWHEYLARCQFLLREGLHVADICLLSAEGSPQTLAGQRAFMGEVPGEPLERRGHNFDVCPPEVVLARMAVRDGNLVLPDGMSYRLLVLPKAETMTPRLLARIEELVEAGATVAGAPPLKSPSLADHPRGDREVERLAARLWGTGGPPAEVTERRHGKGRIIWGGELTAWRAAVPGEPAPRLDGALWVWHQEGNPVQAAPPGVRCFRRVIAFDEGSEIESAQLVMTADNAFTCWVNGREAGRGDDFKRLYTMNLAPFLGPGTNVLAVAARNGAEEPNPAALIARAVIKLKGGRTLQVPTDRSWESAASPPENWKTAASPGGPWAPVLELGPPGMAPWGEVGEAQSQTDLFPDIALLGRILERLGVPPDFTYRTASSEAALRFIHRRAGGTEIYFVANKTPRPQVARCTFRVRPSRPELWWPETGRIERPAVYDGSDGRLVLGISFAPQESVFVVFPEGTALEPDRIVSVSRDGKCLLALREPEARTEPGPGAPAAAGAVSAGFAAITLERGQDGRIEATLREPGTCALETASGEKRTIRADTLPPPEVVRGPWEVRFPPGWGAPDRVTLDELIPWNEHPDPGVRHYSGTALYSKALTVPPEFLAPDRQVILDLGRVEVSVEVRVNGRNLSVLWKAPYRADLTAALRPGENRLELAVANLWVNRMVGDEELPEDSDRRPNGTLERWPAWLEEGKPSPSGRYTFTSWRLWPRGAPLVASGLLGPVRLEAAVRARPAE